MAYHDRHHILNNRQEWSLRADARTLRETPTLIPVLDRDLHETLHANTPPVPLLGFYALRSTLANFQEGVTPLQSMDNLMFAIEAAGKNPRTHPLERSLGDLAIQAIDLQRPYIAQGTRLRLVA